jgi:hypothetical protein
VRDVEATVDALAHGGVAFERYPGMAQDARSARRRPDPARVAWFKDPDGNVLSITQM